MQDRIKLSFLVTLVVKIWGPICKGQDHFGGGDFPLSRDHYWSPTHSIGRRGLLLHTTIEIRYVAVEAEQ
ncbi:hypothetical protein F1880_006200 [Penicillium rolfsii]|nr:hypothetical protein F1880_006200 [Penicillium rolfsii]